MEALLEAVFVKITSTVEKALFHVVGWIIGRLVQRAKGDAEAPQDLAKISR